MLHLRNPLTHDGKQLRDGGPGVHKDLQAGGVVGVKEGEGWREAEKTQDVNTMNEPMEDEFMFIWNISFNTSGNTSVTLVLTYLWSSVITGLDAQKMVPESWEMSLFTTRCEEGAEV